MPLFRSEALEKQVKFDKVGSQGTPSPVVYCTATGVELQTEDEVRKEMWSCCTILPSNTW